MHLSTEEPAASRMLVHLEKLAEMFLNNFHREHILLKLKIKNLLRKIRPKNLTAGVYMYCKFKNSREFYIIVKLGIVSSLESCLLTDVCLVSWCAMVSGIAKMVLMSHWIVVSYQYFCDSVSTNNTRAGR